MNLCRWNGDTGWPTQLTYYIQSQRPTQKKLQSHNRTCTRSCWSAGTGTPSSGPPLSSSLTCLRTSTSHPSLSIWNRHSRCWWVHRDPTRRTGPLVTQPSKVFHNLSIDSNLWSEIGNAHIYLTKNVCVILKKLVSSFCCKFSNFERQNAICSHGHAIASENNLQPRLWDSKDNSAPMINSF